MNLNLQQVKRRFDDGGEKKFICDLDKLYDAFPREFFGNNLLHSNLS